MRKIQLHLKAEYWWAIKNGQKRHEYRIANNYWRQRLSCRPDIAELCLGYPPRGDRDRRIYRRIEKITCERIRHKEFGDKARECFVIHLGAEADEKLELTIPERTAKILMGTLCGQGDAEQR